MDIKISNLFLKILAGVLGALILAGVIYGGITKYQYDQKLLNLSNELAKSAQTIEISRNLYEKATLQVTSLQDLLNSKDEQIVALNKELKDKDQELLTATNLVITWRSKYEALVKATQGTVPPVVPGDPDRIKVSFEKNFGPMIVSGYTLTSPPEAYLSVMQGTPLKLTLAISQDKSLVWHSYVTSSDDNMKVDIQLAAVNPFMLERKWWERLSVTALVAAGQDGALAGVGVGIDIGQFTLGPMIMGGYVSKLTWLVGVNVSWRPFAK
jgi:hypothetical protein